MPEGVDDRFVFISPAMIAGNAILYILYVYTPACLCYAFFFFLRARENRGGDFDCAPASLDKIFGDKNFRARYGRVGSPLSPRPPAIYFSHSDLDARVWR